MKSRALGNPGIGDHDVEAAEVLQSACQERFTRCRVLGVAIVRHRHSPGGLYLAHDAIGTGIFVAVVTAIVDHDRCTAGSELEGIGATETLTGAGHDGHALRQTHRTNPLSGARPRQPGVGPTIKIVSSAAMG